MGKSIGFYLFTSPNGMELFHGSERDISTFLEKCAEGGIRRLVPSMVPTEPRSPKLPFLVKRAHELGMEVMVYRAIGWGGNWEWIYHSNAGEPLPNPVLAPFAMQHPEYWSRTRENKIWLHYGYKHMLGKLGYLAFSEPEVRAWERDIFLDLVECGVDGVQVEWVASPRPPDDPEKDRTHTIDWTMDENGQFGFLYDEREVEEFKAQYGEDPRKLPSNDPRWVAHRSKYVTQHLRELREALNRTGRKLELSAQGVSGIFRNGDSGRQVSFDWECWMQEGLIDAIYPRWPAQYPRLKLAYTPEVVEQMGREIAATKAQLKGKAQLMAGLLLPTYSFLAKELIEPKDAAAALESAVQTAVENGADMVGIYRADRFDALGLWPHLKRLTAAAS